MVMTRREVLVQLDDDLVAGLDELAQRMNLSRSDLLRRGAIAALEHDRLTRADQQLVAAYRSQPSDPALVEAARRLASETAPECLDIPY
jgi:metal-responsive CopG/Arc/MetJ family transcriptional regulator